MSSISSIGGFFELERGVARGPSLDGAILLNSGRACLEYLIRYTSTVCVYLPDFLCEAVLAPLDELAVEVEFYEVNDQLEPSTPPDVGQGELFLYINYFGVRSSYSRGLAEAHAERVVIDGSQSFFYSRHGAESFFVSPRKFFGVPDGGMLWPAPGLSVAAPSPPLELDVSFGRIRHLARRVDEGPEAAYADFRANELLIDGLPMRQMSELSRAMISTIDGESARTRRVENFAFLHAALGDSNQLSIDPLDVEGPGFYPMLGDDGGLRAALIESRIFSPLLWPAFSRPMSGVRIENAIAERIAPLPVDQRYGIEQMERILEVIDARR